MATPKPAEDDLQQLVQRVNMLEQQVQVFNNVILALAYLANVKANSFKYVGAEDLYKFLSAEMRPFSEVVMKTATSMSNHIKELEDKAKEAGEKDAVKAKKAK